MTPSHASDCFISAAVGNAEFVGDCLHCQSSFATCRPREGSATLAKFTHLENDGFGKYRIAVCRTGEHDFDATKNSITMLLVFATRHSLKIFETIVMLFSVFMVRFMSRWNWAMKDFVNQAMDLEVALHTFAAKRHAPIPFRVSPFSTQMNYATVNTTATSRNPSRNAFHLSKVAHFVKTFISWDWFPMLYHWEIIPCR